MIPHQREYQRETKGKYQSSAYYMLKREIGGQIDIRKRRHKPGQSYSLLLGSPSHQNQCGM
jgi:hypothetical protein